MTKAEMQSHAGCYSQVAHHTKQALDRGRYSEAVRLAVESFPHVDGMLQYQTRYENRELDAVETIETVLAYAPLVFEYQGLNAVDDLLRSSKRVDNYFNKQMGWRVATCGRTTGSGTS